MKKCFTILSTFSLVLTLNAQTQFQATAVVKSERDISEFRSSSRDFDPNDTTGLINSGNFLPHFAPTSNVTALGAGGGGYVYGVNSANIQLGNNSFPINEVAQGYLNLNSSTVRIGEAILLFAGKTGISNDPTSKCVVRLFNMAENIALNVDANSPNGSSQNSPGPSASPLAQADLLFNDIDTSIFALNVVTFPQVATVNADFAISVDFADMKAKGDTAGLLSDALGDANNIDYAFHKLSSLWIVTNFLFTTQAGGGINNNIAIFAVVENNFVNIESPEFFNGMKLGQNFPNPVSNISRIEYEIEKPANALSLEIMNINGQKVFEQTISNQPAGRNHFDISATDFQAGVYYYSLIRDGQRLTKKMIISK